MARLFLSHSSRDNIQALAFKNWLVESGWDPDDVFVDLQSIGAGERWRVIIAIALLVLSAAICSLRLTLCRDCKCRLAVS